MANSITVSNEFFSGVLDSFCEAVQEGKYQKLDYNIWRKYRNAAKRKSEYITFKWDENGIKVLIESEHSYEFYNNTEPFAIYIKTEWIPFMEMMKPIYVDVNESSKDESKNEENKKMKNFNFDFGPVNSDCIRMSMYGLAIKNKDNVFVSYDAKNHEVMDVDILNFDGANKFLYKMPVSINDISAGDVVIHNRLPMFVIEVPSDKKVIVAIDVFNGERKEIMLTRSPFGFNFATKVVNLIGNMVNGSATASEDNPFGNMWMLMAMTQENNSNDMMIPMMMMANNKNIDPMMMTLMFAGDKSANDILPMMMMANMYKPKGECKCGGNCNH